MSLSKPNEVATMNYTMLSKDTSPICQIVINANYQLALTEWMRMARWLLYRGLRFGRVTRSMLASTQSTCRRCE